MCMTDSLDTAQPSAKSGDAGSPMTSPSLSLATAWQKGWLCSFLIIFSIATLYGTYHLIRRANDAALVESTVMWQMPVGAHLRAGSAAFHYDPERKVLSHRGPLNDADQLKIQDLLEFDVEPEGRTAAAGSAFNSNTAQLNSSSKKPVTHSEAISNTPSTSAMAAENRANDLTAAASQMEASTASVERAVVDIGSVSRSYHAAISLLAYRSRASQVEQIQLLLLIGMFGGALGAFLRSFVDFVGNACYKNKLNLVIWWPLYATRPVVGAMLGFLLVVLFKARLLTNGDVHGGSDTFWWLGMAALGGFSTLDVTARLRQAAKALFGGSEGKRD